LNKPGTKGSSGARSQQGVAVTFATGGLGSAERSFFDVAAAPRFRGAAATTHGSSDSKSATNPRPALDAGRRKEDEWQDVTVVHQRHFTVVCQNPPQSAAALSSRAPS
jgi:hypothetical protein